MPGFERAVREVSKMLSDAGIRHALVGALGTNAYRSRTRTADDIQFLVGDEAFETHAGGYVTMRVPVIEFEGVALDQVPSRRLARHRRGPEQAPLREGVPIASVEILVVMKLLAGRKTWRMSRRDSGADRELLRTAVEKASPDRADALQKLFDNVDRRR